MLIYSTNAERLLNEAQSEILKHSMESVCNKLFVFSHLTTRSRHSTKPQESWVKAGMQRNFSRLGGIWVMGNVPEGTFALDLAHLPIAPQWCRVHVCACDYMAPLSVSQHTLWGNWRSRWNAAHISFGDMNKSIKQHTHELWHGQKTAYY